MLFAEEHIALEEHLMASDKKWSFFNIGAVRSKTYNGPVFQTLNVTRDEGRTFNQEELQTLYATSIFRDSKVNEYTY